MWHRRGLPRCGSIIEPASAIIKPGLVNDERVACRRRCPYRGKMSYSCCDNPEADVGKRTMNFSDCKFFLAILLVGALVYAVAFPWNWSRYPWARRKPDPGPGYIIVP